MLIRLAKAQADRSDELRDQLVAWLAMSRFMAYISSSFHRKWKDVLVIDTVRLRKSKEYCGQHPNECIVRLFPKKHRRGHWLEGSDWVGFNDGLNDLFDRLAVDADVWSFSRECLPRGRYFIRRGRCRRISYDSEYHDRPPFGGFNAWVRDGEFEDYVGRKAPQSYYPESTPGIPCWRPEDEAAFAQAEAP